MTLPGRSPRWQHWPEAAVIAGKMATGEAERLQNLLDNIADSGHDQAAAAWDALAVFAIKSPRPGALTMTMLALATDGASYHDLADSLLVAQSSGLPLAVVLRDRKKPPPVLVKPEPKPRFTSAPDRDWRAKLNAVPDPEPSEYSVVPRTWRTDARIPTPHY